MKRSIWSVLLAAVLALTLTTPAVASPAHPQDSVDYGPLFEFWDRYGVDQATQTRLFAELQAGEMWDVLVEGSEPVSTETSTTNGVTTTLYTYADGSIAVTTVDNPGANAGRGGGASPASVTKCSYSGGSYWYSYTDCQAKEGIGIIEMWFYFDYSGSYGTSSITDYWGASATCTGCSVSNKTLRKKSSTRIDYTMDVSIPIAGQTTVGMRLTISGPNATTIRL